jgi:hypothetical protein
MDAQRALLDELMGSARNLTEEERRGYKEVSWDDKEVCGFYMVRFCPHDLFVNTRSDLGPCPKIHDPKLKESFENSPRHDAYVPKFEAELSQFCEKLVMDLDRRVKRGRERLNQEVELPPPPPLTAEKSEQLSVLEEKIKNLLEQVESLGEAGKVDEAEALTDELEAESQAIAEVLRIKEILRHKEDEPESVLFESLRRLELMGMSMNILESTAIGKAVNPLRKHGSKKVRDLAKILIVYVSFFVYKSWFALYNFHFCYVDPSVCSFTIRVMH